MTVKPNPFIRLMALLLAASMAAEPALGQLRAQNSGIRDPLSHISRSCAFDFELISEQVLAQRLADFPKQFANSFNNPPTIRLFGWAWHEWLAWATGYGGGNGRGNPSHIHEVQWNEPTLEEDANLTSSERGGKPTGRPKIPGATRRERMIEMGDALMKIYTRKPSEASSFIANLLEREGSAFVLSMIKPEDDEGVIPESAIQLRQDIWELVLSRAFGGPKNIDCYAQSKVKKMDGSTRIQQMKTLPRRWKEIAKLGHISVRGYLPKTGNLKVGRFLGLFQKYGDTTFELEMQDGWPRRIWFEKYGIALEFYPIESFHPVTFARQVVGTHTGKILRNEFKNFHNVFVTTQLDSLSNLRIGEGPPDITGEMPKTGKFWAQLTDRRYGYERVQLFVQNGLICEMRLLDSNEVRYFTRLWSKVLNKYTTSFLGKLGEAEAARINPDHYDFRTYKPESPSNEEAQTASTHNRGLAESSWHHRLNVLASSLDAESPEYHVLNMLKAVGMSLSMNDLFERVRKHVHDRSILDNVIEKLAQLGCPVICVGDYCKLWTAQEVLEWQSERGAISRQAVHGRLNFLVMTYPDVMKQDQYDTAVKDIRTWAARMVNEDLDRSEAGQIRKDPDREIRKLAKDLRVKVYFLLTGHHPALPSINGTHEDLIRHSNRSA